ETISESFLKFCPCSFYAMHLSFSHLICYLFSFFTCQRHCTGNYMIKFVIDGDNDHGIVQLLCSTDITNWLNPWFYIVLNCSVQLIIQHTSLLLLMMTSGSTSY